ncbi:MAG: aminopeptidase P family protein [Fimbriimonadia bacterium]|nr:aminopeptidase P family protein [Fimbriimonadia bacterium]
MNLYDRLQPVFEDKDHPIDTLLITNMTNIRYLTGFTGSFGWLIVHPQQTLFITSGIYTNQVRSECPDLSFRQTDLKDAQGTLFDALKALNPQRLGIEANQVTHQFANTLQEKLEGVTLVPKKETAEPFRLIKTPEEIATLRHAVGIADAAFEHIQRLLQPEAVEWDIAMELDFFMRRNGAYPAFETLVVSGERSAYPHGRPTEKRLAEGDFVTMDFGARYQGYCSDITRTVVIGTPTERHRQIYGAVLEALETAIAAIQPGKKGKEIDTIARETLGKYDLADYFGHGLGHSIGLTVHDGSGFSQREENLLKPGMVVTVEPGVYIPGFGGVRIEDDVLITETGCEVLSQSPRELMAFDWSGRK